MALDLKKLNREQREAVSHDKGPLLIIAGAGTGKTTVITKRITYLIEKGLAKPEEILAVTFTDKAAGEMEERVDMLLPYGYMDLWISTFHSFCERVLRDHALDIGLPTDFKILEPTAGWLLVHQNLAQFKLNYYKSLGNPTKFIHALISHFSRCKDQVIYPEDYLKYADKLKTNLTDRPEDNESERIKEIANAYHTYQRLLLANSSLDFGDLINYCLKLFQRRSLILKKYREKFKYILVDEFQDTNWAQYELIKILAAPKNNLTVTADDDQSIYKWRGASFSNIIQFQKDFPKVKQISLIKNYRSTQNILDLSYKFIKANDPDRLECVNKINKKLIADHQGKGIIEHIYTRTLEEEVKKTIKKILEVLKKDKKINYNDIAILVRANNTANFFTKALGRVGLPYQFLASKGFYSKPIILDIISYFKLLDNYHESLAVYRILNLPFLEIPYDDIAKLTRYSVRKTKSLYETFQDLDLIPEISEKTRERITLILKLIRKHTVLLREKTISEITMAFLEDFGYLKYLVNKDKEEEIDILNQFYKRIKNFEQTALEPNLKSFMEGVTFEIESGEEGKFEFDSEQGLDAINVMTIHRAKGLEFKHVFLVNMVDKRFPTIERKDLIELPEELIKDIKPKGDVHLQEERRICYVAMTRAKEGLYFTSAEDYGLARKKKLSRFLIEMGYLNKAKSEKRKTKNGEQEAKSEKRKVKSEKLKVKNGLIEEKYQMPDTKYQRPNYLPDHFSFSQLVAFEKCPLQYKFNFILKIPIKGKAVFSFGKTMHKTFYNFLKYTSEESNRKKENNLFELKKRVRRRVRSKLSDLIQLYEKNWIGEWYENKNQKEEYYKLGKKIVKDFYKEFVKNPPKILKINNTLALEIPFNLKIEKEILRGVIDRIDEKKEGVAIIDYKTGNSKERLNIEDKKQLLIYQIAAEEIFKIKPKELIYYYLNNSKKVSFLGSVQEKSELKEKIIQEIEAIKKSDFRATPGWQCSFCDFKDICDSAER